MQRITYNLMMEGLVNTAIEKIQVLGREGAEEDIATITKMVNDLESFWNPEGNLTAIDWSEELATAIKKASA